MSNSSQTPSANQSQAPPGTIVCGHELSYTPETSRIPTKSVEYLSPAYLISLDAFRQGLNLNFGPNTCQVTGDMMQLMVVYPGALPVTVTLLQRLQQGGFLRLEPHTALPLALKMQIQSAGWHMITPGDQ
ncbi:hypothetical protein F66182_5052 [Fusarium sp. NRRL 66182]|nr:hypothetical protein F66182_5052 [Fusarium sp. NRRL 66182]